MLGALLIDVSYFQTVQRIQEVEGRVCATSNNLKYLTKKKKKKEQGSPKAVMIQFIPV